MVLSDMVLPGTCRESKGQGHWSPWSSAASWIWVAEDHPKHDQKHGSLNVPIEHHPTIRYMVYNGYYKVMSNIPKMGQLPTPEQKRPVFSPELRAFCPVSQLVSPQNHGHGSPPTWRNLEHPRYVVPPKPEMFIG